MELADRAWRLVGEETWAGPMNMALDEVAAATAADGGPRTARVYRWDPSTLSLGYRQNPATVDWDYCAQEGVTVTRRPTGGGGIYHDSYGDISYTIVAPADDLPGDLMASYELLCEPVLDALRTMGVDATFAAEPQPAIHQPACYLRELHPAHDVVVPQAEGPARKVAGNAQYRRKDAVIQHGSLKYDRRTARHLATFADPETTTEEFEGRVTTIREEAGIPRSQAVEVLETSLKEWAAADVSAWTPSEVAAGRDRAARKFATDAWTRNREDPLD